MTKPISPVIMTFKALPHVQLQAFPFDKFLCGDCRLKMSVACDRDENPNGNCEKIGYIWREVPPKEEK